MDQTLKNECLARFRKGLGVTLDHPRGKVYMVPASFCREGDAGLIISQEGWGCYTYLGDRPLTEFDLAGAGFSLMDAASDILEMMNTLFGKAVSTETSQGQQPKLLENKSNGIS